MPGVASIADFADDSVTPPIRGVLHTPAVRNGEGLVLTHGAGANCRSRLLTLVADSFAERGYMTLRCDLPFRQARPFGPPFPGLAARDREGLQRAVEVMARMGCGRTFLGGHSYGGRQASILLAEQPGLVAGLLLLSYPLHPPRKPEQLRTAHFPKLQTPVLFVHGTRDPFGSAEEMRSALELIPGRHELVEVTGAGHELVAKAAKDDLPGRVVESFSRFFSSSEQAVISEA